MLRHAPLARRSPHATRFPAGESALLCVGEARTGRLIGGSNKAPVVVSVWFDVVNCQRERARYCARTRRACSRGAPLLRKQPSFHPVDKSGERLFMREGEARSCGLKLNGSARERREPDDPCVGRHLRAHSAHCGRRWATDAPWMGADTPSLHGIISTHRGVFVNITRLKA